MFSPLICLSDDEITTALIGQYQLISSSAVEQAINSLRSVGR